MARLRILFCTASIPFGTTSVTATFEDYYDTCKAQILNKAVNAANASIDVKDFRPFVGADVSAADAT